jgi:hypothetical protein
MKSIKFIFLPILFLFVIFYFVSNYKILIVDKSKLFTSSGIEVVTYEDYSFNSFNFFSDFSLKHHTDKTRIYSNVNKKMYFPKMKEYLSAILLNSNSKNYIESKATLDKIISDYIDYKNFKDKFLVSFNNLRYTYVVINKDFTNVKNEILSTYFIIESLDRLLKLSDCAKIYRKFDKIFFENCYVNNFFVFNNRKITEDEFLPRKINFKQKLIEEVQYKLYYIEGLNNVVNLLKQSYSNHFYQILLMGFVMIISLINIVKILIKNYGKT